MRIAVIGGGPAGLYFAILCSGTFRAPASPWSNATRPTTPSASAWCSATQTLDNFARADAPSYRADHRALRLLGRYRDPRPGARCTASAATASAAARAVPCCCCCRSAPGRSASNCASAPRAQACEDFPDADLIVAADGINSPIRDALRRSISSPRSTCARTASPGWAAPAPSTPSPSSSRRRPHGIFIAHCYQYEADRQHLGAGDRSRNLRPGRPRRAWTRRQRPLPGRRLRRGAAGPPAHHQPLAFGGASR